MNLRIKKNPLAKVAFRNFALCLCLLASNVQATAQEVVYELVTNESQLVVGEKYIITTADGKYAMGYQKADNRHAVSIDNKKVGNYIVDIPIASKRGQMDKVYEFVLKKESDKLWSFRDSVYNGFLYAADNENDKYNLLKTNPSAVYKLRSASIGFKSNVASITFAPKHNGVKRKNLSFYKTVFSCYNTFYTPISLYRKVKHIAQLSVSKYGYTTYTSQEYNYIMPKGCLGFVVTKENDGIKLTEKYKPGDAVPAKTPLLIKDVQGTYTIYQTSRKAVAPTEGENLLRGEFDAEGNITYGRDNKDNYYYYKLTTNKDKANFGFYFGEAHGWPFKMSNTSRAYLVLPREQSNSVKSLVLDDAILETAVSLPTESKPTDGHTYDLSGRLCQGKLVPGIYIQNGRKIVVR